MSVLAEAGPRLAGALLDQGWVDELVLFYAPLLLADNQALPAADGRSPAELTAALRFRLDSYELVGEDLMVVAYPCSPD
jgi:diaminohydroxyphosphoribosylaminopyrimidine deaminase/5-amino-6-(5-phosphoribosylamino)uracil reductase